MILTVAKRWSLRTQDVSIVNFSIVFLKTIFYLTKMYFTHISKRLRHTKNRDIKNWLFTKCMKLPLWFGLDQRCFDLSQMSLWFSNYYYKKMLIIIQWCLWIYEQEVGTHYLFYKLKKTGPSGENTWVLFAYILSMCVYEKSC